MFFGWILIAIVIYYMFANNNGTVPKLNSKSPKEILDERFVNGEIDEATYTSMIRTLEDR